MCDILNIYRNTYSNVIIYLKIWVKTWRFRLWKRIGSRCFGLYDQVSNVFYMTIYWFWIRSTQISLLSLQVNEFFIEECTLLCFCAFLYGVGKCIVMFRLCWDKCVVPRVSCSSGVVPAVKTAVSLLVDSTNRFLKQLNVNQLTHCATLRFTKIGRRNCLADCLQIYSVQRFHA